MSWSELSLLEWESTLGPKPSETQLQEAESKVAQAQNDLKSPAAIILFAALYNFSSRLASYPACSKFILSLIQTEFGKTGIELATVHTTTQKVDASSVTAGIVVNAEAVPGTRQLRSGIFAKNLDGKKMYYIS